MPTYEFRCPNGHDFEKFYRSISGAEAQAACLVCGKPSERRMSAAGFAFKGSGFYLTDYGKNAHRGDGAPDQKAGAGASKEGSDSTGDAPSAASKSDAPKSAEVASSGGEKKAETKAAESKPAESKPAPPPAKPSKGE